MKPKRAGGPALKSLVFVLVGGCAAAEVTDDLIRCVLRNARSHEDIGLLPLLRNAAMHTAEGPTFVELGALDGEDGSQTWLLEHCFGWRGVLIEASPLNFAKIASKGRDHAVALNSAVCTPPEGRDTGEVTMMTGGGSVAGVVGQMPAGFLKRWAANRGSGSATVPCRRLGDLVAGAGLSGGRATFLSLDVEGAEEVVIRTLNLTSGGFPFSVVMVEADRWDRAKNARVDQLLLGAGLVQLPISASSGSYNHLFVRPQLADSRPPHLHIKSLLQNYSRYVHAHGLLPAPDSCGAPSCMPTALGRSNASYFVSQLPAGLPGINLDS